MHQSLNPNWPFNISAFKETSAASLYLDKYQLQTVTLKVWPSGAFLQNQWDTDE